MEIFNRDSLRDVPGWKVGTDLGAGLSLDCDCIEPVPTSGEFCTGNGLVSMVILFVGPTPFDSKVAVSDSSHIRFRLFLSCELVAGLVSEGFDLDLRRELRLCRQQPV